MLSSRQGHTQDSASPHSHAVSVLSLDGTVQRAQHQHQGEPCTPTGPDSWAYSLGAAETRGGRPPGCGQGTHDAGDWGQVLCRQVQPCPVLTAGGFLQGAVSSHAGPSAPGVTLLLHLLQKKVLHGRLFREVGGGFPFAVHDADAGSVVKEVPVWVWTARGHPCPPDTSADVRPWGRGCTHRPRYHAPLLTSDPTSPR